jgi:hypothetical protein
LRLSIVLLCVEQYYIYILLPQLSIDYLLSTTVTLHEHNYHLIRRRGRVKALLNLEIPYDVKKQNNEKNREVKSRNTTKQIRAPTPEPAMIMIMADGLTTLHFTK